MPVAPCSGPRLSRARRPHCRAPAGPLASRTDRAPRGSRASAHKRRSSSGGRSFRRPSRASFGPTVASGLHTPGSAPTTLFPRGPIGFAGRPVRCVCVPGTVWPDEPAAPPDGRPRDASGAGSTVVPPLSPRARCSSFAASARVSPSSGACPSASSASSLAVPRVSSILSEGPTSPVRIPRSSRALSSHCTPSMISTIGSTASAVCLTPVVSTNPPSYRPPAGSTPSCILLRRTRRIPSGARNAASKLKDFLVPRG